MNTTWRDIRFALRSFSKNRGFTAAILISIALGIAANTTVFTMVNALLLGDMPVREPASLLSFSNGNSFSTPDFNDYREQTRAVFEDVSAHFPLVPASFGGKGEPERLWGQLADAAFFSMLGVPMELGRGFRAEENDAPGKNPVLVLSNGLWRRRFGADRSILGRAVVLNGSSYTVIGVTKAGFHGMDRGIISEFWAPLSMADQIMPDLHVSQMKTQRTAQWLMLLARLKPGVSQRQAVTAVNTVKQRLEKEYRKNEKPRPAITLNKAGGLPGSSEMGITALAVVLMVVVGLVLMIACVNVASLLLSRATTRQREIGIRLSIGAGRWRLVRQLLTESLLLSLGGAIIGLTIAAFATRAIAGFQMPLPVPIGFEFNIDMRVLLFTAGLSIATGILFGLAPALRATRPDVLSALKNERTSLGGTRPLGVRNILVLVQIALSLVLLVGSGLFLRSLQNASSIDLGMRTDGVLMMAFDPKLHHYSPEKTKQFISDLRQRVTALPGVTSVSYVDSIPLSIGGTSFDFKTSGVKDQATGVNTNVYMVGAGYFTTMGIRANRGRDFDLHKDNGSTVIVNEELAHRMFPGQDALGRQIEADGIPGQGVRKYEIVGVVRNSKSRTLGENTAACAYLFLEAKPEDVFSFYGITVVLRSTGAPGQLARGVRDQIHALDPNLPVFNIETMNDHVNKSMLLPRLCAMLLGIFGAVGVILATVGLYGVMSFAARARTKEIGIRMALGAQPATVLKMITRQGLLLAGAGLAIGMALAFALTRFTASLLYGVSTTDATTFIAVPAILLAVAFVAVLIPARRAASVAPLEALHCD